VQSNLILLKPSPLGYWQRAGFEMARRGGEGFGGSGVIGMEGGAFMRSTAVFNSPAPALLVFRELTFGEANRDGKS
jgi:hypothetical protein